MFGNKNICCRTNSTLKQIRSFSAEKTAHHPSSEPLKFTKENYQDPMLFSCLLHPRKVFTHLSIDSEIKILRI